MGLLDLPTPLFAWFDGWLSPWLPPLAKLVLWAVAGALVSMELYRLLSPQRRIATLKEQLKRAQQRLNEYDGDFDGAWPLITRMLGLALRRVSTVVPSTLIASLPVLVLIVWINSSYGRTFPAPGEPAAVEVAEPYRGEWVADAPDGVPRAVVRDDRGTVVAEIPVKAPVPVVHKRRWWNLLIGNPAGYLASDAPVDHVGLALPRQQFLGAGPAWMRGWELAFFTALLASALAFKFARRIE